LNPDNGECIFSERILYVANRLQEAIKAVTQGRFEHNREKDELTYALQNPEHPDQT
jgi:hypothetical protein